MPIYFSKKGLSLEPICFWLLTEISNFLLYFKVESWIRSNNPILPETNRVSSAVFFCCCLFFPSRLDFNCFRFWSVLGLILTLMGVRFEFIWFFKRNSRAFCQIQNAILYPNELCDPNNVALCFCAHNSTTRQK